MIGRAKLGTLEANILNLEIQTGSQERILEVLMPTHEIRTDVTAAERSGVLFACISVQ